MTNKSMKRNAKPCLRRTIAFAAAAFMFFETPFLSLNKINVQASEIGNVTTNVTVSTSDVPGYGQVQIHEDENGQTSEEDNVTTEIDDLAETDIELDEEVKTADLKVNYLYIENIYIESPDIENIMVSIGEKNVSFADAMLTVKNVKTEDTVQLPMTKTEDDALCFAFDTGIYGTGTYQVTDLSYSYQQEEQVFKGQIPIAQIPDMENICFGVNEEVSLKQSDLVDLNPESASAYSIQSEEDVMVDGLSEEELAKMVDINVINLNGVDGSTDAASQSIANTIKNVSTSNVTDTNPIDADTMALAYENDDVSKERAIAGSVVVVLDPGHDTTHAGARGNGLNEEELNLKVANYCKAYLEANYTNVVVYMTRTGMACPNPGTDSGIDNERRVAYAKSVGADIYVSIHFNTTGTSTTSATGSIVFYPNSNYNNSVGSTGSVVASKIIEQLAKLGLKNNGIQTRGSENNTTYPDGSLADYYGVIRNCKLVGIPAVIVEHAFLNNPADGAWLKNEDNVKKLGVADALGIAKAYNLSQEEIEYDAEDLSISNVDNANGSFLISLTGATPVERIAKVRFKVYPTADSSLSFWYDAEEKGKGNYTALANVSNHGMTSGRYKVIAYAYDAAGRKNQLRSATVMIEEAKLDANQMSLTAKLNRTQKVATISLKGNQGAANVYYKVYSNENGKDDIKTYNAEKLEDGTWQSTVTISNHKTAGDYTVIAYSKSFYGTITKVKTTIFTVDGPKAKYLRINKVNLNKGTFQIRVTGVESLSKIKSVKIKVRNYEGKKKTKTYAAKKSTSGYYYVNINMKDHDYQLGRYLINVIATDGNNIEKSVLTDNKVFEKPLPVIKATLKSKQSKLYMTAEDLGIDANIKGVRFRVYNVNDSSSKKNYEAKINKLTGKWSYTAKISDFGTSGTYNILTYVKGADGRYRKVGKNQKVVVDDIVGGVVTTKSKSDSSTYLYVGSISANCIIEKVEVKAWPAEDSSAKYTYKASLRSNEQYRVLIDTVNHANIGGTYRYQVFVTGNNGIKKLLLRGNIELEAGETDDSELYSITGLNTVTVKQMMDFYNARASYPGFYKGTDAPTLKKFCQIYYNECQAEGIKVEVAFAQAMKETNFLRYSGDVKISQFNFAGIGATGGGVRGNSFNTVTLGVRAQVQHLKAYANYQPLNQGCVDPRFSYVQRGTAPYVEWLGIQENPNHKGWATDPGYGRSLRTMINELKNY